MILHRKNSSVLYANVYRLSLLFLNTKSKFRSQNDNGLWIKKCKLKQNLLNCLSKPSKFISCDVKVRKNRIWRMKKQLLTGFRLELAAFGNIGKVSGSGISQFSPLKYILRGNAHPLLNVNDSESFSRRICVVTDPT